MRWFIIKKLVIILYKTVDTCSDCMQCQVIILRNYRSYYHLHLSMLVTFQILMYHQVHWVDSERIMRFSPMILFCIGQMMSSNDAKLEIFNQAIF